MKKLQKFITNLIHQSRLTLCLKTNYTKKQPKLVINFLLKSIVFDE